MLHNYQHFTLCEGSKFLAKKKEFYFKKTSVVTSASEPSINFCTHPPDSLLLLLLQTEKSFHQMWCLSPDK